MISEDFGMKSPGMNEIFRNGLVRILQQDPNAAFAYIFGSCANSRYRKEGTDLDLALYFYEDPDPDRLYRLIRKFDALLGDEVLDFLVLNGCENYILRHEVLCGEKLFSRDEDLHAAFFSWSLRMYEDEKLRREKRFHA